MSKKQDLIKKNKNKIRFDIFFLILLSFSEIYAISTLFNLFLDFNPASSEDVNTLFLSACWLMSFLVTPYFIKEIRKSYKEVKNLKENN